MKTAIAYLRVSTLKQVKGHSLDYQKAAIEKYCEDNGIKIEKTFIDKGLSGYKYRPEFKAMDKYIDNNSNALGLVITYSITRYGRSTQDLLFNIEKLEEKNIQFVSIKEQFDVSTKTGKLLLGMLALIADFEAETIKERMEAGRAWAQQHGTKSGKPFGRPIKEVDWEKVKYYREHRVSWRKIAEMLELSTPTLTRRARKEGFEHLF